jgi:hypothetical protein
MRSRRDKLLFALGFSLLVIALLAIGHVSGRMLASAEFRKDVAAIAEGSTLGMLLRSEESRRNASVAYLDPGAALAGLDSMSWAPPNVPAPFVGCAPRPGVHGNATINSMHFRHDGELARPKPAGVIRIFVTGGSTAYGSGAPAQDRTISAYLGRLLPERPGAHGDGGAPASGTTFEVVNAANPGWSTTQERILVENRLAELEPDLVISLSGNNDVHWGQRRANVLWYRSYEDDMFRDVLDAALALRGAPELPENAPPEAEIVAPEVVAARLVRNVELAAHALALRGARYVFALQPTLATTRKPLTPRERGMLAAAKGKLEGHRDYFERCYARIDEELRALRERLGEPARGAFVYVDLAGAFDDVADEIFVDSYHFGDRGNERVARALATAIEGLVPR